MTQFAKWPSYSEEEANLVAAVLKSNAVNYWNGQEGKEFEREFAEYHGVAHGIAVANGTLALELAFRGLGVPQGSGVVVTPRSFYASASSIVTCGLVPVFADVDRDSQNISAETIRKVLTPNTKAILTVHLAGWPCDMESICELAEQEGLAVVEDCAQAHGARLNGQLVGSFGAASAFSFCTDKIMTTGGEGGMTLFKDREAYLRAWSIKDHGKSWRAVYEDEHPPGFRWLHEGMGSNWRLTEMQSALGRYQLKRLEEWVEKRRRNASRIGEVCKEFAALRVPEPNDRVFHAYYKFYAFLRPDKLNASWGRDRIVSELQRLGIPVMHGSCPEIYLEKGMVDQGYGLETRLPVARELGETSLMSAVHPTLGDSDLERICGGIREVMGAACA